MPVKRRPAQSPRNKPRTAPASARRGGQKEKWYIRYAVYIAFLLDILATFYIVSIALGQPTLPPWATYESSITLSFLFPLAVFSYMLLKGRTIWEITSQLGLSGDKLNKESLKTGVMLFLAILLLEMAISLFSYATNIPLPTNTSVLLTGAPLYFLFFGIFVTPLNEEILFRGFLVPRIGIVLSAIIFAVLHAGYGSISELVGALAFGLLAGYAFKRTGSLYATILAHLLVNLLAIIAFLP